MPDYAVKTINVEIAGLNYVLCLLADHQQFSDVDGSAERAGISSATWPIFGQLWPAGKILAGYMANFVIDGKRMLEMGCGMGLSSLVLKRRGADITATDYHPLAGEFLAHNCTLNSIDAIPYFNAPWGASVSALGFFDVIFASDVLYERGHAEAVAGFVERHSTDCSEVILTDPGRGHFPRLRKLLIQQGFVDNSQRMAFIEGQHAPFRGCLAHFRREMRVAKES